MLREMEQQLAARTRAARLHEAEVPGRDFGVTREIELTEAPPLSPLAQQIADVRGGGSDAHTSTLTPQRVADAYGWGNPSLRRRAPCSSGTPTRGGSSWLTSRPSSPPTL